LELRNRRNTYYGINSRQKKFFKGEVDKKLFNFILPAQNRWINENKFKLSEYFKEALDLTHIGRVGFWAIDALSVNLKVAYHSMCPLCNIKVGSLHFKECVKSIEILKVIKELKESRYKKLSLLYDIFNWYIWWRFFVKSSVCNDIRKDTFRWIIKLEKAYKPIIKKKLKDLEKRKNDDKKKAIMERKKQA